MTSLGGIAAVCSRLALDFSCFFFFSRAIIYYKERYSVGTLFGYEC